MKRQARGFTLIEVMIVVAIIAILTTIAYPSYIDSVRKGHRTEAKDGLVELSQIMERIYTENLSYNAVRVSGGGTTTVNLAYLLGLAPQFANGTTQFYNFTFATGSPTATTYTLTATPKNDQTSDICGTFSIDNTGAKTVTGTGKCW